MRKNNIYLLIITFFIISCSDSKIKGDWKVSYDTLYKGMWVSSSQLNTYYKEEMKDKFASKLSGNIKYSFMENQVIDITVLSDLDSIEYQISGSWKVLENSKILEINLPSQNVKRYTFNKDEDRLFLYSTKDSSQIILDKY
tara:strand:+ start:259 stop:681 length:423 start_codon:yes stop_codon:yes gene_type:complete